jgi:hypothetical protein
MPTAKAQSSHFGVGRDVPFALVANSFHNIVAVRAHRSGDSFVRADITAKNEEGNKRSWRLADMAVRAPSIRTICGDGVPG